MAGKNKKEKRLIVRLSVEESVALAKFLAKKPKVNKASVAAMRRHKIILSS